MRLVDYSSGLKCSQFGKNRDFGVSKHYMANQQQTAKKPQKTVKQLQAEIKQLKKDLAEEDRVNSSAVKKIDELRLTTERQKETIALQRMALELQAVIFARTFNYMNSLEQQMQDTLQK
jgi:predicted RNase H-like nuclease (RuvC/YqgF family)